MWIFLATLSGSLALLSLFFIVDWYIAVGVALLVFMPMGKSETMRRLFLFDALRRRLNYNMEREFNDISNYRQQCVFAVQPHGPFCFSMMLTWVSSNRFCMLSRHRNVVPLVASQLLRVPILGAVVQLLGCESVSKDNFQSHLARGNSVALAPGGTREMRYSFECTSTEITLVRRANPQWLECVFNANVPVVPVLSVGECSGYTVLSSPSWLQRTCQYLFGYPFPVLAFGTLGTAWPRRGELSLLVCEPIHPREYNSAVDMARSYYAALERVAEERDSSRCRQQNMQSESVQKARGKPKKSDFRSLRSYVQKVARNVDRQFDVKHDAVYLLDELCFLVVVFIMKESALLLPLKHVPTTTIGAKELRTVVEANYNNGLGKLMIAASNTAVTAFKNSPKKGETSAKRSGLILAPPRVLNHIKRHHYSPRNTGTMHICCTAMVEAVLRKILVTAMGVCRREKKKTITRAHVEAALRSNEELGEMFAHVDVADTPRSYGLAKAVDCYVPKRRAKKRAKSRT